MNALAGYGLIGCGGFGRFCLEEYKQMPELRCIAVADSDEALARKTAKASGVECCASPEALLARPDIHIVHLATPPFTHPELAMKALRAGKHVLCEKPLALTLEDAESMVSLAREMQRVLAVNLIMRYNPLCTAVKQLIERRILGEPLFATLMNAAQDQTLHPAHWFWDRNKSGGIFIEHGVHFFDLFEWWFGSGKLLSAHQVFRPGTEIIDQVQCTVRYPETLGTFYHGFHQMLKRDHQAWRIEFETGTLTMSEWVPTSLELDAHLSEGALEDLSDILPGSEIEVLERYTERKVTSRHRERGIDLHARVKSEVGIPKLELYGEMLRALMRDQLKAVVDPHHHRLVGESNGVSSLRYAVAAQAAAEAELG